MIDEGKNMTKHDDAALDAAGLEAAKRCFGDAISWGCEPQDALGSAIVEYLSRAYEAHTRPEPVAVKALEWTQKAPPCRDHEPFRYWAAGIGGHYTVEPDGMLWMAHDEFIWKQFPSQAAAKAAAQADYEARIRSAIASPAKASEEAEPVAWWVHGFHITRQPVKARGKFPEVTEYLYPAFREQDAKSVARTLGGECTPLYAALRGTGEASSAERELEELRRKLELIDSQRAVELARSRKHLASKRRMEEALRKIAEERMITEKLPNENRIMCRDDMVLLARAALSASADPNSEAPAPIVETSASSSENAVQPQPLQAQVEAKELTPPPSDPLVKQVEALTKALRTSRTLVIAYRAQEKGRHQGRYEYCDEVLAAIDAELGIMRPALLNQGETDR